MIEKKVLEEFKIVSGFNLYQIEKDYLQHLFLLFLSKTTGDDFVFKGGTALQKVYGLHRFSEDLDFTLNKKNKIGLQMEKIKEEVERFGISCVIKQEESNDFSTSFKFKFQGPLYTGAEHSKAVLRIEISKRESVLLEPVVKEITPKYPDIQPYLILAMKEEEILAEKIRAILTRSKSRDIYDLWFLLEKGTNFDEKLVNKKLEQYKLVFNKKRFIEAIASGGKTWNVELKILLNQVPEFENVKKYIFSKLKLV